jgi:predicted nucleic acid-binding protein
VGLLDVNVLFALVVPEREHHVTALEWFTTRECVVTFDRALAVEEDVVCLLS